MKRLLTIALAALTFTSFSFAEGFFGERFFELKFDIPVSVTNNTVMLADVLQEEVLIDLAKIADDMPSNGFSIISTVDPSFGVGLNVLGLHFGMNTGVESFAKFGISKGLFNFLGYGNKLYEDLDIGIVTEADVFAHADINASFSIGDFKISATPSVFLPVVHVTTEDSSIKISNDETGKIGLSVNANAAVYTMFDVKDIADTLRFDTMGFDLAGSVSLPIKDLLVATVNLRTPIVPGRLKYMSGAKYSWDVETRLMDVMNNPPDLTSGEPELTESKPVDYYINRPFKLSAQADFKPLGDFFVVSGRLGFGVRNPFKKSEVSWYPEYCFGARVSAANIVSATVATEYTDQIFRHSIAGALNLRVLEIDAGVSLSSSGFVSSFRGAGFSAFLTTYIGF